MGRVLAMILAGGRGKRMDVLCYDSNYATLGEFVLAVRELRTHEQLLALLEEERTSQLDFHDTQIGQRLKI